jgi:hypothetical protein
MVRRMLGSAMFSKPIRHVFGHRQCRGGYRDPAALLVANLVQFVERFALAVFTYTLKVFVQT